MVLNSNVSFKQVGLFCSRCLLDTHSRSKCRNPIKCHKCMRWGHTSADCPPNYHWQPIAQENKSPDYFVIQAQKFELPKKANEAWFSNLQRGNQVWIPDLSHPFLILVLKYLASLVLQQLYHEKYQMSRRNL